LLPEVSIPGYSFTEGSYAPGEAYTPTPDDYIRLNVYNGLRLGTLTFEVGDAPTFHLRRKDGLALSGTTYAIRDMWGAEVVPETAATDPLVLDAEDWPDPGWWVIYLLRATPDAKWGRSQGKGYFSLWRPNDFMPPIKTVSEANNPVSNYYDSDPPGRSQLLLCPSRLTIDNAADPTSGPIRTVATVQTDLAMLGPRYLDIDTARAKAVIVNFHLYSGAPGEDDGVGDVVEALGSHRYEARNEPEITGFPDGEEWAEKHATFRAAVKGADPDAIVIGPACVTVGGPGGSGGFAFLADFLAAGGITGDDELSVHGYNMCNGDLPLGRMVMDRFRALIHSHGLDDVPVWMTEWGAFFAYGGVTPPLWQARQVMLMLLLLEQYGIPKERFMYFYDGSHGFWGFPSFLEALDGINNSLAMTTIRVYGEELFGTNHAQRYSFGTAAEAWTLGSRFDADDGSGVVVLMSAGRTDQQIDLRVSGAEAVTLVSPVGVESTMPVSAGLVTVDLLNGLPMYVRIPVGATVRPLIEQSGADLLRGAAVTVSGSGAADPSKITDGRIRNGYFEQEVSGLLAPSAPFIDDTGGFDLTVYDEWLSGTFPSWAVLEPDEPVVLDRLEIVCHPPYQAYGTLLDFDVQTWTGGDWLTLETITEPAPEVVAIQDEWLDASRMDTFHSGRCVFVVDFAPTEIARLRIYVRDATRGFAPTDAIAAAGAEHGPKAFTIRAVRGRNRSALPAPKYGARVA
jgi:hypothetical protein